MMRSTAVLILIFLCRLSTDVPLSDAMPLRIDVPGTSSVANPRGIRAAAEAGPLDAPAASVPTGARAQPLLSLWDSGDFVTRGLLLGLLAMFIGSWYFLASRIWSQVVLGRHARTLDARFWTAPNLYEAVQQLEPESTFRTIAQIGLEAATHQDGRLTDRIDTSEWIALSLERSVTAVNEQLQRRLGVLGTVAAAAVAAGLFGALWGLYGAFMRVATHGSVEGLAIGEALLMAALGLFVAFPAAAGHRWLIRRNGVVTGKVRQFAIEIQAVLLSADGAIGNAAAGMARGAARDGRPVGR